MTHTLPLIVMLEKEELTCNSGSDPSLGLRPLARREPVRDNHMSSNEKIVQEKAPWDLFGKTINLYRRLEDCGYFSGTPETAESK